MGSGIGIITLKMDCLVVGRTYSTSTQEITQTEEEGANPKQRTGACIQFLVLKTI